MALDKNGVPIPVYVPPPPPPPDATPPDQPNPQLENDVALLKGDMETLNHRYSRLESLAGRVEQLGARAEAIEALRGQLEIATSRFTQVEADLDELLKLALRVGEIERLAQERRTIDQMLKDRLDSVEKMLFAAQERGLVDPVSST